jgi:nucleotide-binding universal stress UspA family protein
MPKFERILFPIDFSERSRAVAPFVLSMAQRYNSQIVALHVMQPPPPLYAEMNTVYPEVYDLNSLTGELRNELQKFCDDQLPKVPVSCAVEIGDPAAAIADFAENENISLIVMPTHGYGIWRRALLGSVTAKILHDVKIPVWTAAHAPETSHRAHPKPRHILCALDLKAESLSTLEFAISLAAEAEAKIEVVSMAPEGVVEPSPIDSRLRDLLAKAEQLEPSKVEEETRVTEVETVVNGGSVAHKVRLAALERRSDLVVIGRGSIHHAFGTLFSNSYDIICEAPCPVLSV